MANSAEKNFLGLKDRIGLTIRGKAGDLSWRKSGTMKH